MVEVRIIRESDNPLLKRREMLFEVPHSKKSTPSLFEVRQMISAMKGAPLEAVYVVFLKSMSGKSSSRGEAHVYYSPEYAVIEPLHVKVANLPPEEKKKAKEEIKKKRMEMKAKAIGGRK
ncbi:MAG: 30S ribosomal protein S24e [Crenarchaeota archaeon]|nr:30S ribosomal protein S24e [Thermoproteota archaeon]MDW8033703.1 30S ribosomal protein S24e [Nitrososphaerota archaeon]